MRLLHLLPCILTALALPVAAQFPTQLSVDTAHPLGPVRPLILGNNLQWVDRGDEMFLADGKGIAPAMLARAREMGVSLLRYPGGSLSDLYHWRDGMGPMAQRGQNEHFYSGRKQKVEVGTQEFLELCEALGAQPLITVNALTGTPAEAADWVRQVNVTGLTSSLSGKRLPRVKYWEIGNEPYLKDDKQKKLWMAPEAYAARAQQMIVAMRAVDPDIEIAVPLRSDKIGGLPATPLPGFNETVLKTITAPFNHVALHNAYLPMAIDANYSEDQLYWASVAATRTVEADFAATRSMLARLQPGRPIRLAVTEHNALYTLGKSTDAYLNSPAGALYVADLLRLFAYTPDLDYANFWSLSGNWHFGAIDRNGGVRPQHAVLRAYRDALKGRLLPVDIKTATVDIPRTGYVMAASAVPKVKALATVDDNRLRVLLINHDPQQASSVTVSFTDARNWTGGRLQTWRATARFDTRDNDIRMQPASAMLAAGSNSVQIQVPPVGLALLELDLPAVTAQVSKRGTK